MAPSRRYHGSQYCHLRPFSGVGNHPKLGQTSAGGVPMSANLSSSENKPLPPPAYTTLPCAGVEMATDSAPSLHSANGGGLFASGRFKPATNERQTASKARRHRQ
jgi:hypothetical protein